MMRNIVWIVLGRLALALLAGVILMASAFAPAHAAVPGDSAGFDHFVDCAWLIITDGPEHHLHCGPNHVELAPGFPGTGTIVQTPSIPPVQTELPAAPSCCPCSGGGASIDMEMGVLVAAGGDTLWTGPGDPLEEFLLACCPCGS